MKTRGLLFFILALTVCMAIPAAAEDNYMFHNITATVMAGDPDRTAGMLADWADRNGGYFILRSTGQVVLRFPFGKTSQFREFLDTSTEVYSYSAEAVDLRESILTYQSGIEAREEILSRNMTLVARANFNQTLFLEQEILRLMDEIETLKGNLKKAENDRRMAYAVITINFQSQTLPENIPSSFSWINNLDFYTLVKQGFSGSGSGSFYRLKTPQGFALVQNGLTYRAISPEGVRLQIRRGRNYPKKGVDFWAPAMVRQLRQGGYQGKGDGESVDTALGKGFYIEWGVPFGQQDFVYLVAIIPRGKHIYMIEAAGDVRVFGKYRDTILDVVKTLKL
jgi:hypothetical protein